MANFVFYSICQNNHDVVCKIVEKLYNSGSKCLLLCASEEQVDFFDAKLWTFSKLSFIPHGSRKSVSFAEANYCHTWISEELDFVNAPECVVSCGVPVGPFDKFKKVIDVFLSDEMVLAEERAKFYGARDCVVWEQGPLGWREREGFGN